MNKKRVLRIAQFSIGIFAVLSLLISTIALYSYFSYEYPTKENFVTVSGKIARYEKKGNREHYLDIFLIDNPLRFRIDINQYKNYFKKEIFFATVKPNSDISIEVNKEALEKPFAPLTDPVDTVFVETIRDNSNIYTTWEDRIKWHQENRVYALYIGIAFLIGAIILTLIIFLYLPKFILQKL